MQDIEFYIKSYEHRKKILNGEEVSSENVSDIYENCISRKPVVFQIETTNACPMSCVMCPRTTKMKREVGYMDSKTYEKIIDQIEPFSALQKLKWQRFVGQKLYGDGYLVVNSAVNADEDFFHYVISAGSLTLHGFGEPPVDPKIVERVRLATNKGIPTYFSCVPLSMTDRKFQSLLDAGISFVKYSVDGLDEDTFLTVRGKKVLQDEIVNRISRSIEQVEQGGYSTIIVLTMLGLSINKEQNKEFIDKWRNRGVFAYIKNAHNRWLSYDEENTENTSHHMRSFCEYPWNSVSILRDGSVVPCPVDYDGALTLGNVNDQSLEAIWNSKRSVNFRKAHAEGTIPDNHFCKMNCDMPILGDVYKQRKIMKNREI